jgi:hypothetical protein
MAEFDEIRAGDARFAHPSPGKSVCDCMTRFAINKEVRVPRNRTSSTVRRLILASSAATALFFAGCAAAPPPEAAVPMAPGQGYVPHEAPPKPLPESALNPQGTAPAAPYADAPILDQRVPEEPMFLAAYNKVHQPRIAIYVNRTLQGQIIPANPGGPVESTTHTQSASGAVTAGSGDYSEHDDAYGRTVQSGHGNFSSSGPAEYTETTTHYLAPGEYDEAEVKTLDYLAVENILADAMSCGGQVHLISSDYLAAQLSPADMEALAQGKPVAMNDLAQKVGADVLVQVQARPTRQANGLQIRLVAEAMNIRGGEMIGNAVVDVPPPLDKPTINEYTRFMARKLMTGMSGSWESYAANPPPAPAAPPPAVESAPLPPVPPPAEAPAPAPLPPVPPPASAPPPLQAAPLPPVPPPQSAAPQTQPAQRIDMIP